MKEAIMTMLARMSLLTLLALSLAGCAAPAVRDTQMNQPQAAASSPDQPKIVLYSTSWCPHCKEAKEYFKQNNIVYINRDVEEDSDAMEALTETYKSRAVPVIVIGNDEKILKGFKQAEFEKAYGEVKKAK